MIMSIVVWALTDADVGFDSSSNSIFKKKSKRKTAGSKSRGATTKVRQSNDQLKQSNDSTDNWLAKHPFFIIAGTQKSGTTALAAYLTHHPGIQFAKKKEVHFFDKKDNYNAGIQKYLSFFSEVEGKQVYGEATPYYIASRDACRRISEYYPQVKMIILLREPTKRMYSEYNMKRRRVVDQAEFHYLAQKYSGEIYSCLLEFPGEYSKIKRCVPKDVREHPRWSKFVEALKKSEKIWGDDWDKVVHSCYSTRPSDFISAGIAPGRRCSSAMNTAAVPEVDEECSAYVNSGIGGKSSNNNVCFRSPHPIVNTSNLRFSASSKTSGLVFNATSCWSNYKTGLEHLKDIDEAMVSEPEAFLQCAAPYLTHLNDDLENAAVEEVLGDMDTAIDKCLRVRAGLSAQYFYRSLYAVQLYHCFKVTFCFTTVACFVSADPHCHYGLLVYRPQTVPSLAE